jgi:hypothetical protein
VLTKADDYPIHQTPDPIAVAADRNVYDRYFFNGHAAEGLFFGAAFGVYPFVGIMDGAFSVAVDGVQHNLHVSRHILDGDRTNTQVGPLKVEVVEPLKTLRVQVSENEHGIEADLLFHGRTAPLEEPRSRTRRGAKVIVDLTRMTQNGVWEGWIKAGGRRVEVRPDKVIGVRDRSWGIRPFGVPQRLTQQMWLWAPMQSEESEILFYVIEKPSGDAAVVGAQIAPLNGGEAEHMADAYADLEFRPGTREISKATLHFLRRRNRGEIRLELEPRRDNRLFLSGLGYGHQQWGHGFDKGELAVAYDKFDLAPVVVHAEPYLDQVWAHYQARTEAKVTYPDGRQITAHGCLEQIVLGDHAPTGLTGLVDPQKR